VSFENISDSDSDSNCIAFRLPFLKRADFETLRRRACFYKDFPLRVSQKMQGSGRENVFRADVVHQQANIGSQAGVRGGIQNTRYSTVAVGSLGWYAAPAVLHGCVLAAAEHATKLSNVPEGAQK
jgi:hypothetical protein